MKTLRALAAFFSIGLLLLSSCADADRSGAGTKEPVRIGVMADDAPASDSVVAGILCAHEVLAESGNPVELVFASADEKGAEELIGKGVCAVIFAGDSGGIAPPASALAESGIPVFAACRVPEREIPEGGRIFCLYPLRASFGAEMAEYVFSGGAKIAVSLTEKGSGYSSDCGDAFVKRFRKLAGEEAVPLQERYQKGQTEFAALLDGISYAAADVVFLSAGRQTAGRIVAQAKQAGLSGVFALDLRLSGESAQADQIGVLWLSLYDPADEKAAAVFAALSPAEDDIEQAILGYDAYDLLFRACGSAEQTGMSVEQAVRDGEFTGITGAFLFDENRVRIVRRLYVVTQRQTGPVCLREIPLP